MPRKYEAGTFEGHPNFRWVKMYNKQRHRVTCEELGLPTSAWTKADSYLAANEWWRKKRAEIDGREAEQHPQAENLAELQRRLEYANRHGLHGEGARLAEQAERTKNLEEVETFIDEETTRRLEAARLFGIEIPENLDDKILFSLFGNDRIWGERFRAEKVVPRDKTIGGQAELFLKQKIDAARKDTKSVNSLEKATAALDHFKTFLGEASPVENIFYDTWEGWYTHCAAQVAMRERDEKSGWASDTAATYFKMTRAFVRWLWERDVLEKLPKNIDSEAHRFERPETDPATFTNKEIKLLLDHASGQHKLHLYLMLNTGMTQRDISELRKAEVIFKDRKGKEVDSTRADFKELKLSEGFIKRRRSKTRKKKHTPEVTYPLWPETLGLLQEHWSADPVHALITQSGRRWVRKEVGENDKPKKADNIATLYRHLRRRVKLAGARKSLKVFRSTSATRLNDSDYRDLRFYFLGHSARHVADRNYAARSQRLLGEAVTWLRGQYQ